MRHGLGKASTIVLNSFEQLGAVCCLRIIEMVNTVDRDDLDEYNEWLRGLEENSDLFRDYARIRNFLVENDWLDYFQFTVENGLESTNVFNSLNSDMQERIMNALQSFMVYNSISDSITSALTIAELPRPLVSFFEIQELMLQSKYLEAQDLIADLLYGGSEDSVLSAINNLTEPQKQELSRLGFENFTAELVLDQLYRFRVECWKDNLNGFRRILESSLGSQFDPSAPGVNSMFGYGRSQSMAELSEDTAIRSAQIFLNNVSQYLDDNPRRSLDDAFSYAAGVLNRDSVTRINVFERDRNNPNASSLVFYLDQIKNIVLLPSSERNEAMLALAERFLGTARLGLAYSLSLNASLDLIEADEADIREEVESQLDLMIEDRDDEFRAQALNSLRRSNPNLDENNSEVRESIDNIAGALKLATFAEIYPRLYLQTIDGYQRTIRELSLRNTLNGSIPRQNLSEIERLNLLVERSGLRVNAQVLQNAIATNATRDAIAAGIVNVASVMAEIAMALPTMIPTMGTGMVAGVATRMLLNRGAVRVLGRELAQRKMVQYGIFLTGEILVGGAVAQGMNMAMSGEEWDWSRFGTGMISDGVMLAGLSRVGMLTRGMSAGRALFAEQAALAGMSVGVQLGEAAVHGDDLTARQVFVNTSAMLLTLGLLRGPSNRLEAMAQRDAQRVYVNDVMRNFERNPEYIPTDQTSMDVRSVMMDITRDGRITSDLHQAIVDRSLSHLERHPDAPRSDVEQAILDHAIQHVAQDGSPRNGLETTLSDTIRHLANVENIVLSNSLHLKIFIFTRNRYSTLELQFVLDRLKNSNEIESSIKAETIRLIEADLVTRNGTRGRLESWIRDEWLRENPNADPSEFQTYLAARRASIEYVADRMALELRNLIPDVEHTREIMYLIERQAFMQHQENPEYYVSHGFDHSLNVRRYMDAFIESNPRILEIVANKYGISTENANILLSLVAIFHDFGYPTLQANVGKAAHTMDSALVTGDLAFRNALRRMLSENGRIENINFDQLFADFTSSILFHNADKIEGTFAVRITNGDFSYLSGRYSDQSPGQFHENGAIESIVDSIMWINQGGRNIEIIDASSLRNFLISRDEAGLPRIRIELADAQVRRSIEAEIRSRLGSGFEISRYIEFLDLNNGGSPFSGRFMDRQAGDRSLGLEFRRASMDSDPLNFIIRLTDNCDMARTRLSELQRTEAFRQLYEIYGGVEEFRDFTRFIEQSRLPESGHFEFLQNLESRYIEFFENQRSRGNDYLGFNVQDFFRTYDYSARLSQVSQSSSPNFRSFLRDFDQAFARALGRRVRETNPRFRSQIEEMYDNSPLSVRRAQTFEQFLETQQNKFDEAAARVNTESLRHFGGSDVVRNVAFCACGSHGTHVRVTVNREQWNRYSNVMVSEKLIINGRRFGNITVSVAEYQIWRQYEAYRSLSMDENNTPIRVEVVDESQVPIWENFGDQLRQRETGLVGIVD